MTANSVICNPNLRAFDSNFQHSSKCFSLGRTKVQQKINLIFFTKASNNSRFYRLIVFQLSKFNVSLLQNELSEQLNKYEFAVFALYYVLVIYK